MSFNFIFKKTKEGRYIYTNTISSVSVQDTPKIDWESDFEEEDLDEEELDEENSDPKKFDWENTDNQKAIEDFIEDFNSNFLSQDSQDSQDSQSTDNYKNFENIPGHELSNLYYQLTDIIPELKPNFQKSKYYNRFTKSDELICKSITSGEQSDGKWQCSTPFYKKYEKLPENMYVIFRSEDQGGCGCFNSNYAVAMYDNEYCAKNNLKKRFASDTTENKINTAEDNGVTVSTKLLTFELDESTKNSYIEVK